MQTYIKVLAPTFSPHSEYVPNKFQFIKIIPLCHSLKRYSTFTVKSLGQCLPYLGIKKAVYEWIQSTVAV